MIESFNGRLRDECLNANVFLSIDDARRVRIDVEAAATGEAAQGQAAIVGQRDRQRARGTDADQHGGSGDRGLLDEFERQSP